MATRRYQLLQAIVDQVKTVTIANGFAVEFSDVFQQVGALGDDVRDQLPVAAVVELPEQPEVIRRDGRDTQEHQRVVLTVQAWDEMDENATTAPAYELLAALQLALRKLEKTRPENAIEVRVAPGYVTVPD